MSGTSGKGGDFPVVGIGASAGGLRALEALLQTLPADTGAAYVVIQHLDPDRESLTAEILERHTKMPTVQITQGMEIEPDHVYVIPPASYLTLKGHTCILAEPVKHHGLRLPVDAFFRSLASEHGERAIAIIASGTGSDGVLGLREVKGAGGIVMVQDPETAEYDGMPRSAIATQLVDVVCPIEEMPNHLTRFFAHHQLSLSEGKEAKPDEEATDDDADLRSILAVLQSQVGCDFRNYKRGTIRRRIARRMGLRHSINMHGYLDFLREHPDEVKALYRDLLISVTAFFRDAEAFRALEDEALRQLVEQKPEDEPIRVWVPGCATGEEAFSIAMMLIELLENANKQNPVQIFASDLDETALAMARNGVFPESLVADMPAERLRRFFVKEDGVYRISKTVREIVTFAIQNVITDPPFSKLDLISCRNLLIYLNSEVQRKVLGNFHFALREDGILFLGQSETIGQNEKLFAPIDKRWRIYRRVQLAQGKLASFSVNPLIRPISSDATRVKRPVEHGRMKDLIQQQLLEKYAPAAVLVDARNAILYYVGPTSRYLEQPSGMPSQDLMTLAHFGLRANLRSALRNARSGSEPVVIEDANVKRDGARSGVRITVRRVESSGQTEPQFLITFEDREQKPPVRRAIQPGPQSETDDKMRDLEFDLAATREELQSNIEELESANEELQAANEEVMSVNEELQSANEEMETSKEELQSMNEELTTVNSQLKSKVEQLAELNDDLTNFVSSTGIATVFLDINNRIGRFTPATKDLFNLIATDIGRPIADIRPKFVDDHLLSDVDLVIEKLQPITREIVTDTGEAYLRRVLPYRTGTSGIGGVVIAFVDISERLKQEKSLRESEARFRNVVENAPDPMLILDAEGKIMIANRQAEKIFEWSREELQGKALTELISGLTKDSDTQALASLTEEEGVRHFEEGYDLTVMTKSGEHIPVIVGLSVIAVDDQRMIGAVIHDVTERKRINAELNRAMESSIRSAATKSRFLATASHDLRQPLQAMTMRNATLLNLVEDTEQEQLLLEQRRSLHEMRAMLHSLLRVSRLDAGTVEVKPENIDLHTKFGEVASDFRTIAARKGLDMQVSDCTLSVRTDGALLGQLLRNLVDNAVRYTEKGFVRLSAAKVAQGIRVTVQDSGPGIPEDRQDEIFEEFVRVDHTGPERDGGLGLGLSIVKRIAALLDAPVEIDSKPGKGSAFSVILEPAPDAGTGSIAAKPDIQPQGGTILHVDDDDAVRKSTSLFLSTEKTFEVLSAKSPKKAFALLKDRAPDLILADYHLGKSAKMTGDALIAELRRRIGKPVPAILMTGDTSDKIDRLRGEDFEIMIKPIDATKLVEKMHQLLAPQE